MAVERLDKELPGTLGRLGAGKELPGEVRVAFAALEVVLGLSGEFRQVAELADLRKSRRSSTTVTPKEDP